MSNLFVLGLGLATVFAGLICIIIICKLMSAICSRFDKIQHNRRLLLRPLHLSYQLKRLFLTGRN